MASGKINVNKADINLASLTGGTMPLDVMGLFFFAYRDFVGEPDRILSKYGFGRAHHRVTPSDGVVASCPGQNKALVAVKDREKLGRGIRGDALGMVDRALHGLG